MDIKRSVTLAGHRTSVALEAQFWEALKDIAREQGLSQSALIARIDAARLDDDAGAGAGNLSRAIRVFVLRHYQEKAKP